MMNVATITKTKVSARAVMMTVLATCIVGAAFTASNFLPAGALLKQRSLDVSLSGSGEDALVVGGTHNQTFAWVVLENTTKKAILVTELNFVVTTDNTHPAEVSNFRLIDNDTQLATTNDPDSDTATKTIDGQRAVVKFVLSHPLRLDPGVWKRISVKADVSSAATTGVYKVGMPVVQSGSPKYVIASYVTTGKPVSPSYTFSEGFAINFRLQGFLTIGRHIANPESSLVPENMNGVVLALLSVAAHFEDIQINKLYITGLPVNGGGWDQIDSLDIYSDHTFIGNFTPTSTDSNSSGTVLIDLTNNPIIMPAGGGTILKFLGNMAKVNDQLSGNGSSFEGIKIAIASSDDIYAAGLLSGTALLRENKHLFGSSGNDMYLVRSLPTLELDTTGGSILPGITTHDLYEFSIFANGSDVVGVDKVSFNIVTSGVDVENLRLIDKDLPNNPVAVSSTTSGVVEFVNLRQTIPADFGARKHYALRGDIVCTATNGCSAVNSTASVAIQMLGDTAFPDPLPHANPSSMSDKFVWTDFAKTSITGFNDDSVYTESQWSNSYLLPLFSGSKFPPVSTPVIFVR